MATAQDEATRERTVDRTLNITPEQYRELYRLSHLPVLAGASPIAISDIIRAAIRYYVATPVTPYTGRQRDPDASRRYNIRMEWDTYKLVLDRAEAEGTKPGIVIRNAIEAYIQRRREMTDSG